MDYGLVLPTMHAGASAEGIEAAAEVAERVGWSRLDDGSRPRRARLGGRVRTDLRGDPDPRPRRGAASGAEARHERHRRAPAPVGRPGQGAGDARSCSRAVGSSSASAVGWDRVEFANLGMADRFHVRGAYLDETVRLWRHLWGGATTPFHGRFHDIDDFVFEPLPPQGAGLPVWFGGRAAGGARASRTARRWLPLELDGARHVRRADPHHPRGRPGRRTSDADPVGAVRRPGSGPRTTRTTRCAGPRTRSGPASPSGRRSASATSRSTSPPSPPTRSSATSSGSPGSARPAADAAA